ncbi:MAG: hypothetical protein PUI54_02565 [Bacteroidales bacterium]|nr:hypothetical protein [Bacteroidales bacterium]MDY2936312.1 hypothetical protein [Candidatus Cryptobacteroides sp.]
MKKLIGILTFSLMAVATVSCYDISPRDYDALSPLSVSATSDTINVNLGTKLVYNDLNVESATDVSYQWSYGAPAAGKQISDHEFATMETISTSKTIDYAFPRVGSYILRLRVDNGSSIVFKYFTLNVNSGYDEGVAILSNDSEGKGALSFVKTLTPEEIAAGEQQVFFNIFSVEGKELRNGTALWMSDNTYKNVIYSGFLIATNDENATIYHMDCKTFEFFMSANMADYGSYCEEFGGEYAEDKSSFGCFFRSPDGRFFRYDMNGGFITEMTDLRMKIDRIVTGLTRTTAKAKSTRTPFFWNADTLGTRKTASAGNKYLNEEGWRIVTFATKRQEKSTPGRVLVQSISDPTQYRIYGTTTSGTKLDSISAFTAPSVNIDCKSKFVNTTASSDVYYVHENAIYRWNLSSAPSAKPAITLPSGEIIRDIATNYKGRAYSSDGEDLLYVATYNPQRSGEHKGSLFVYRFSDDSLASSYEGIFNDPVSVIYKYRIN